MPERLRERLIFIRETLKMDIKKFSTFLDLHPDRYVEYERGRRCISIQVLLQISEKLGISTDFLLGLKDYDTVYFSELLKVLKNRIK